MCVLFKTTFGATPHLHLPEPSDLRTNTNGRRLSDRQSRIQAAV
jgi:hypothetical protein